MAVQADAVASILGIGFNYVDLKGGNATLLPQALALFVQGETAVTYPLTKFRATSAAAVGERFGYRSPAYLAVKELLPLNGDGVGSIPIDIFPLDDHASGTVAAGSITPSGTTTKETSYVVVVNGIIGEPFTLPVGSIDVPDACRKIRESVENKLGMPVIATNTYGTVTATPGGSNTGDGTVASLSATGTPLPGDYLLTCTAAATDAGTFKLVDPEGTIVSSSVSVTGAPQTVGGIQFTLSDGATDFAVGDVFTIAVPATNTVLTSSWKGASANSIQVEVRATESVGAAFAVVQPTGGTNNPSVSSAISLMGQDWYTMGLNQFDVTDSTALDAFKAHGEGRWNSLVHQPIVFFTGNTDTDVAVVTAVTSARRDDRVNSVLVAPGSPNLPFVVAARQLARIVAVANNDPAKAYVYQKADTLTPGNPEDQWTWTQRDQANKLGCSTVLVEDGVVYLGDIKTMWRPAGEDPPAYANVVTIVKLQQVAFNLALKFKSSDWAGAPLVPDDEPTRSTSARKPKHAKADVADVIDGLSDVAVLVNRRASKSTIVPQISSSNPDRLDITFTVQVSGNVRVISIPLSWGFNFGSAAAA